MSQLKTVFIRKSSFLERQPQSSFPIFGSLVPFQKLGETFANMLDRQSMIGPRVQTGQVVCGPYFRSDENNFVRISGFPAGPISTD